MPHTQQQYQVRLATSPTDAVAGDIAVQAIPFPTGMLSGWEVSLRNCSALARECVAEQERRGERTSIVVVVNASESGPVDAHDHSTIGFSLPGLVVAGAFIEALSELGIDHTSPEAAVARAAWVGVRPVVRHLLAASTEARIIRDQGDPDRITRALEWEADSSVFRIE